jgi:hypothetical protein
MDPTQIELQISTIAAQLTAGVMAGIPAPAGIVLDPKNIDPAVSARVYMAWEVYKDLYSFVAKSQLTDQVNFPLFVPPPRPGPGPGPKPPQPAAQQPPLTAPPATGS